MSEQESSITAKKSSYEIISNPSKVIDYHQEIIDIDGASIEFNLVRMKRSFLLVINNYHLGTSLNSFGDNDKNNSKQKNKVTRDDMIRGFMDSNLAVKGLSLAIGQLNTCIINSNNSLASATLASRLSKKLNQDRPVYVANNFQFPHNTIESETFMAKLYMKAFQFVKNYYKSE